MGALPDILLDNGQTASAEDRALMWLAKVLTQFAQAEQALGRLSVALDIPITNGSLSNLEKIRQKLIASQNKKAGLLEKRITTWLSHRPLRHLLAHATITCLQELDGTPVIVTRHLPLEPKDVTPDKIWYAQECEELLRKATDDGRSIGDHVEGIIGDKSLMAKLKKPA